MSKETAVLANETEIANAKTALELEEEAEDIMDARIADEIMQEMIDSNVDINTLTTNSELMRKYGL